MPRRTKGISDVRQRHLPASMRPGRNAPENNRGHSDQTRAAARFNEAGAKCPGERGGVSRPLFIGG